MAQRICSVEGCSTVHYAKGYCNRHWSRWRRNGDPVVSAPKGPQPKDRLTPSEKQCTMCGVTKSSTDFRRRASRVDGLDSWCRACASDVGRAYYQLNKDAFLVRWQAWRAANPARYAAIQARASERNAAVNRQRTRDWRLANPERAKRNETLTRLRRADRLRQAVVEPVDLIALWTGSCGICGAPLDKDLSWPHQMSKSIDHIIPLSRGGNHVQDNLQWAHLGCNTAKGARLQVGSGASGLDTLPDLVE